MKKMLVVYYSWSCGNTERIAKKLSDTTGADIERIETVKPYTGSYDDVVNQGQQEVNSGYCPEIKPLKADLSKYDVIALGTPTWWYTMAPAMLTFIKNTNFEGKTVIPFQTDGGWPGHTIKDIKKLCKGAETVCDMEIQFDSTGGDKLVTDEKKINAWIDKVKSYIG